MNRCSRCKRATGLRPCSWADRFEPVKGWVAEKTVVSPNNHYTFESYDVKWCPLYERGHAKIGLDDGDVQNLVCEIILQAVEDWKALDFGRIDEIRIRGQIVRRWELIDFFNSKYFSHLCAVCLPHTAAAIRKALKVPRVEVSG